MLSRAPTQSRQLIKKDKHNKTSETANLCRKADWVIKVSLWVWLQIVALGLIKSKYLQTKFHSSRRPSDPCSTPPNQPSHGVCVQANPIVVLNALGYIGFKVVSTCGDAEVHNILLKQLVFVKSTHVSTRLHEHLQTPQGEQYPVLLAGENLKYSFLLSLCLAESFTLDTSIVWSALIIVVAHSEVPRTSKDD